MEGFNLNDKRIPDDKIVIPRGVNKEKGMEVFKVLREIFPDEYDNRLLDWVEAFFKGDSRKFHSRDPEDIKILKKLQTAYQKRGPEYLDSQELKRFMKTIKSKEGDLKKKLKETHKEALQYGDGSEDPKKGDKDKDVVSSKQVNDALKNWKKNK